jgi:hypothetical protein
MESSEENRKGDDKEKTRETPNVVSSLLLKRKYNLTGVGNDALRQKCEPQISSVVLKIGEKESGLLVTEQITGPLSVISEQGVEALQGCLNGKEEESGWL